MGEEWGMNRFFALAKSKPQACDLGLLGGGEGI